MADSQVSQKTNTMAILAIIFGFLAPLLGVIFGIVSLSQIKKTGEGGKGLAMAGIIIGAIAMVLIIVISIVTTMMAASVATDVYNSYPYNYYY